MRELMAIFKETAKLYGKARTTMLGAAISFYAIFSLAPLVVLAAGIAGLILEDEVVRGYVQAFIAREIGPGPAELFGEMVRERPRPGTGLIATITGIALLVFASTRLFVQLQKALNQIWGRPPETPSGLGQQAWRQMEKRLLSFALVVLVGLLLVASVIASTVVSMAGEEAARWVAVPQYLIRALDAVAISLLVAGVFTVLFKVLPDVPVGWRPAFYGGIVAAVFFTVGRVALGFYLGRGAVASAYGAAGALVVVVLWVYYSTLVVFFGAVFSRAYTERLRRPKIEPTPRWTYKPPPAWRERET